MTQILEALRSRPDDETTFRPTATGSFDRGPNRLQNWISDPDFPPERDRYHLYVNYGCGWAHQVLLVCSLRKIPISKTHVCLYRDRENPRGTPEYSGYQIFNDECGCKHMRDVYNAFDGCYGSNQLTIPVLFDKRQRRAVSNDPAQILLMLDFFAEQLGGTGDIHSLYPLSLQKPIEAANEIVYPCINNGVYCCWIQTSPEAFQEGLELVAKGLTWFEDTLEKKYAARAEAGATSFGDFVSIVDSESITLADVRAFPHLFRFDIIYWGLMLKRDEKIGKIDAKYPHITRWLRAMFSLPGVRETCDAVIAGRFYYSNLPTAEADGIFLREKPGWMPGVDDWEAKRKEEGLDERQCEVPPL
eukprot:g18294.t1